MKTVFEASSSIEAYMVKGLLESNGIKSEVLGEHLQSGIGEIAPIGLVRVQVHDADYVFARDIIANFEASQPSTQAQNIEKPSSRYGLGFASIVIGALIGSIATYLYIRTPFESFGVDYNGDGVYEERYEYEGDVMNAHFIDMNRDGEFDGHWKFSANGRESQLEYDTNFDGESDVKCHYKEGLTTRCSADFDGDGFKERRSLFTNGILSRVIFYDPKTKKVIKKQFFVDEQLRRAEIDRDGDGTLETFVNYDRYEEAVQ